MNSNSTELEQGVHHPNEHRTEAVGIPVLTPELIFTSV